MHHMQKKKKKNTKKTKKKKKKKQKKNKKKKHKKKKKEKRTLENARTQPSMNSKQTQKINTRTITTSNKPLSK